MYKTQILRLFCASKSSHPQWGWVICLSFLLLYTTAAGVIFAFGETIIPISKDFHENMTLMEWVGSFPVTLSLLATPLATWATFKYGAKKTTLVGVFGLSMALSVGALSPNIGILFIVYGVCGGTAQTLIINPAFFLLEQYFPYEHPRHVLATSIIACAFPLATLIFNPLTYSLISSYGWRTTYSIFACIVICIGSLNSLTFLKPGDSCDIEMETIIDNEETVPENEETSETKDSIKEEKKESYRSRIVLGSIWLVAATLKSIGYYIPYFTLVKQMDTINIPQSMSSKAMIIIGVCEVVSRVASSCMGEYLKGKMLYTYIIFAALLSALNALSTMANSYTDLLIYGAALGILGGPIIAAMYSSCSEVISGDHVPLLFTIFRVGMGLGCVMGTTIAGAIFDSTGSFTPVFILQSMAYGLLTIVYLIIIWINKTKPKWCFPEDTVSVTPTQPIASSETKLLDPEKATNGYAATTCH